MAANRSVARLRKRGGRRSRRRNTINRIVENDVIRRVSHSDYKKKLQSLYGGPQGALLATCSVLSLHVPLGERLFKSRRFDIRGMRSILDVGSGAGQIARHLIKYADPATEITCIDLSRRMLARARQRLSSPLPSFLAADLAHLPFADGSFDGVTCGYVLEHLPDPEPGLLELSRVLRDGGRMLLLTTEDNFSGAWTSRVWCCRTYNRRELRRLCESLRLRWRNELWFTKVHRLFRAGGICVEIEKTA